jgi:Spy/CpxP family protein refolding chaperone
MVRHICWTLAALLALPAAASAVELCDRLTQDAGQRGGRGDDRHKDGRSDDPRPKPWWLNESDRSELGLSDQQSASIDQIWQKSLPKLREAREQLDKLEDVLSKMILDAADEAAVAAQIERVENTRAEANKARTLMLYRMNRLLSPEQRIKLKALHDRREASRRESPKGPPPERRQR